MTYRQLSPEQVAGYLRRTGRLSKPRAHLPQCLARQARGRAAPHAPERRPQEEA